MSFISVIIPNHQCAKWLPITLDSCLAQKEYVKEIIVIDDHSTDNSLEVLNAYRAQYPDMVRVYRNKEKGGNHARNYGYQLSGGAYIQWLDADDQVLPGKFAGQLEAFGRFPGTDIVYSDWQLDSYDEGGNLIRQEFKKHRPYEDFLAELLQNNWSPPHNYLLKRSIAGELGDMNAWNPDTPVLQDREYFTLAAIAGAKFQYVPGNFSVYNRCRLPGEKKCRGHAGSSLRSIPGTDRKKRSIRRATKNPVQEDPDHDQTDR
jgi:glycosyltransferase involved in cell wall biosynthesis